MSKVLVAAGIYNLLWGLFVVLFPLAIFSASGMEPPLYPQIWQCVGMIVGVFGIGYLAAAGDPLRHWPIVLVGLLGKIFGPIGFISAATSGSLPWSWGWTILTNDLLWWIPFGAILYHSFRAYCDTSAGQTSSLDDAISKLRSHRGLSLGELSRRRPTLVVFLRHAGCTFCREALDDLRTTRKQIERLGLQLAVVHMSPPLHATQLFTRFELSDVHRFSDPTCTLYEAFGLERGKLRQLFGPIVWFRAIPAFLKGMGLGRLQGDGFRLPGVFVIQDGKVISRYRAQSAADRPNYVEIAQRFASSQCEFQQHRDELAGPPQHETVAANVLPSSVTATASAGDSR